MLLVNTAHRLVASKNRLLGTIAYQLNGEVTYALEGSILSAGTAIQWLRDGLGLIARASDVEALAASVGDSGGVYLVPAFTGLGAPYWDPEARGATARIHARLGSGRNRARGPGQRGVSDARPARRDGGGRVEAVHAESRRRDGSQWTVHAAPRRRAGPADSAAKNYRVDRVRRRLFGRTRLWVVWLDAGHRRTGPGGARHEPRRTRGAMPRS